MMNREIEPKGGYKALEKHFGRLGKLNGVLEILHWDSAVMMPPGAASVRAEKLATMKVLIHELSTDPLIGEWLEQAKGEDLGEWQRANLKEIERFYLHSTSVPADLVETLSRAASICENCWRTARKNNDFKTLAPHLTKVVNLTRQVAKAKAEALGTSLYNALHDQFEPGGTTDKIDALFEEHITFLPSFLEEVLERQSQKPKTLPQTGPFPLGKQKKLIEKLVGHLGFDFNYGRVDVSLHPFCGGSPDDLRITTRYYEDNFLSGLMSVAHEVGHGNYERNLPAEWRFQPVGQARSLSIHESQSLLMEMQACRTPEFIRFLAPIVQVFFGKEGDEASWDADNLYQICTKVERSLIRVEADEVTYPAHVILRYQLEKAMMSGELEVKDLPTAWNEGMEKYLGITPPDDRNGCMQDIHWMDGTFGYFPTYTMGAMTAAQLFQAALEATPEIPEEIGKGNFEPLLSWLRENIHSKGSLISTDELLIQATGKPLDASIFREHLKRRYLGNS